MYSLLINVFGSKDWEGKVFLGFSHFVSGDIVSSSDVKLSIEDAKKLIDELVSAVNEVEAREGNN